MPDTVVITRPAQQAGPLAASIAALGLPVTRLPLLEIHALDGEDECAHLQAVLARLREFDLVAFVSPNAIDCVFAHLPAWPLGVPLAVV
ncbi:MAG: uroporphyrinogen-III synthase, partial [Janthinobacterium sp.]